MPDQDDDDRARRATRGSMEIVTPGIPSRHLPKTLRDMPKQAPPLPAQELESTPAEPWARKRVQTQVGGFQPAPGAPAPPPAKAPRPEPPRSVSPPPWASARERAGIERDAQQRGYAVVEPPVSAPMPAYPPAELGPSPARYLMPWWQREEGVERVLKGIGALIAGTLVAFGTYRLTQPAPPPAADIQCPPFADSKAHRGALCTEIYQLDEALGTLQAERDAAKAREERARKMLEQEPVKVETPPKK